MRHVRLGRASAGRYRVPGMSNRVLLLSWEYPPVIEGGLARHVRKLAEALVRQGVVVDVLTRGVGEELAVGQPGVDEIGGVTVHRVREPGWPRDLDRFVAWGEQMNGDMLAGGGARGAEERGGPGGASPRSIDTPSSTATTGLSRTPPPRSPTGWTCHT